MKGKHTLVVQSVHLKYEMTFSRNITIIQGDSATGKTTLVDMIQEYLLNGTDTGINLSCDCPCRVISGNSWIDQLIGIENSLVFIDEGNRFVSSEEFAHAVRGSTNYFVIVTREALDNLSYSVTEIYGIKSSGKYNSLEPVFHHMYRIYSEFYDNNIDKTESLLIEDSNSGYDFFSDIVKGTEIECKSAFGSGKIFGILDRLEYDKTMMVVADGAAFGAQMGKIYKLLHREKGVRLYLPESFEWLILSSEIVDDKEISEILKNPAEYIDGAEYFSWERFFTDLLVHKTQDTWMWYSKTKLNPVFLQRKYKDRIFNVLPKELQEIFR